MEEVKLIDWHLVVPITEEERWQVKSLASACEMTLGKFIKWAIREGLVRIQITREEQSGEGRQDRAGQPV